jgi:hypothetical protein
MQIHGMFAFWIFLVNDMFVINWKDLEKDGLIYKCASRNLRNFLLENDCACIGSYYSPKTTKEIWVFVKSQKLQSLLGVWTQNNPNKKRGDI